MLNAPCKDCPNRSITCHSTCPAYISFAEEAARQREVRYKERLSAPTYSRKTQSPWNR